MKFRRLINLALFISLGFSIVHEYASTFQTQECSNIIEYITQCSEPSEHQDNICDVHAEYHQAFIPSEKLVLQNVDYLSDTVNSNNETYNFKTYLNFFKPPIA